MRLRSSRLCSTVALFFAVSAAAGAQVTLPKVLSNHMVVQRDLPVHVWGFAPPGESVTTTFRGETRTTTRRQAWRMERLFCTGRGRRPIRTHRAGNRCTGRAARATDRVERRAGRRCVARLRPVEHGVSHEPRRDGRAGSAPRRQSAHSPAHGQQTLVASSPRTDLGHGRVDSLQS